MTADLRWVIGKVQDDENRQIDEVLSPRSSAEIIQAALGLELRKAGYTVIPVTKRSGAEQRVIELAKTEIELEQISDLVDLKAKCRVLMGVDVFTNGQLIKRLQYESISSKTDIKDRDMESVGEKTVGILRSGQELTKEGKRDILAAIEKGQETLGHQKRRLVRMIG